MKTKRFYTERKIRIQTPLAGVAALGFLLIIAIGCEDFEDNVDSMDVDILDARAGSGDGLTGTYFEGTALAKQVYSRVDRTIDFDWQKNAPDSRLPADLFSVRWTGFVAPKFSETYTFYSYADDGMKIWVDNKLVVADWSNHGPRERSGTINLQAGKRYPIKVEYYENAGGALAKVLWSSPSQPKQVIPAGQFFTSDQDADLCPDDPNKTEPGVCGCGEAEGSCSTSEKQYEAENNTGASGCQKSTAHAGFTGSGFMDFGGNGSWIEWNNVAAQSAGDVTLTFRYANGSSGNRQAAVIVNGQSAANIPFASTGSWKNWRTTALKVSLRNGTNTIRIQANTGSGGPNLDHMLVTGSTDSGGEDGGDGWCGLASENKSASLQCPTGTTISRIEFASYGLPTGSCETGFAQASCHAASSKSKVEAACLGKSSCTVAASNGVFGDPCSGKAKRLAIVYTCGDGVVIIDNCPNDPNKTEPGECGCGRPEGTCNTTAAWKFVVVGDSRGSNNGVNTSAWGHLVNAIVKERAEFVLFPGDLTTSGTLSQFDQWIETTQPLYDANIDVYAVRGNHDDSSLSAWNSAFSGDYRFPQNGPSTERNLTYAVTHKNVFFVALDNYSSSSGINQSWLNTKLAENTATHVFAFGHEPAFAASHQDCLDDNATARNQFWESLKAAGVRAYFAGHDHFYDHARIDDRDGNSNNDIHQFIVGTAGAPVYSFGGNYSGNNGNYSPSQQAFSSKYGYIVVEVNDRNIQMTYKELSGGSYVQKDRFSYSVGSSNNSDLCPNDPKKTEPGECGCGVAEGTCGGGGDSEVNSNLQVKLDGQWRGVCCNGGELEVSEGNCDWKESGRVLGTNDLRTGAYTELRCPENDQRPKDCDCAVPGERMHGIKADGNVQVKNSLRLAEGAPIYPNSGMETCIDLVNGELQSRWTTNDCPPWRLVDFY